MPVLRIGDLTNRGQFLKLRLEITGILAWPCDPEKRRMHLLAGSALIIDKMTESVENCRIAAKTSPTAENIQMLEDASNVLAFVQSSIVECGGYGALANNPPMDQLDAEEEAGRRMALNAGVALKNYFHLLSTEGVDPSMNLAFRLTALDDSPGLFEHVSQVREAWESHKSAAHIAAANVALRDVKIIEHVGDVVLETDDPQLTTVNGVVAVLQTAREFGEFATTYRAKRATKPIIDQDQLWQIDERVGKLNSIEAGPVSRELIEQAKKLPR